MKYKRRILLFLFIIILSIGMFTVTGCGSNNNDKKNVESSQLWTCGMHPEVLLEEPGRCPKCGMNLVPVKTDEQDDHSGHKHESDAPQLWTCGMHPEVLLEEPGQCPKCGMDLEEICYFEVKIDKCNECNGVWFDHGELDAITKYQEPGFFKNLFSFAREGKKKD